GARSPGVANCTLPRAPPPTLLLGAESPGSLNSTAGVELSSPVVNSNPEVKVTDNKLRER
ncbi:MAG TPA: hypothetical protein DD990_16700, partial [Cyanobacteria bacterium UBA11368]|nr:hypothetical protein [Cyanobacteria bacterium UBA11368]